MAKARTDEVVVLGDVASEQWGLVTAAQAKERGVSLQGLARLTEHGRLERLMHGVYRVAGAPPHPLDQIRAAWLALDPGSLAAQRARQDVVGVVSHRSAAQVYQVGDLDTDRVEFTTRRRRQTRRHDVRFHVLPLTRDHWQLVDGLPVTTLTRTIGDLAKASVDGGHLAGVVRDAVVDHHVDIADVEAVLAPFAHRYGVGRDRGDDLVSRLLQEAGIPDTTKRAVAAAERSQRWMDPQLLEQFAKVSGLEEFGKAVRAAYGNEDFVKAIRAAAGTPDLSKVMQAAAGTDEVAKAIRAFTGLPMPSSAIPAKAFEAQTEALRAATRPASEQATANMRAALASASGRDLIAQSAHDDDDDEHREDVHEDEEQEGNEIAAGEGDDGQLLHKDRERGRRDERA